jgi:hypothetical protein
VKLGQKIIVSTPNRNVVSLTVQRRQVPFDVQGKGGLLDDPIFRGSWELKPDAFTPSVEAIVELANGRDDENGVCRFTRKYGPLFAKDDGLFAFPLFMWREMQAQFRCAWDGFLGLDSRYPSAYVPLLKERAPQLFSEPLKSVQVEGRFELTPEGLHFVAQSLYGALLLVLIDTYQRGLLRHCAKPDCENPYFIAAHPKQRYCTELCGEWAQAQAKTTWWKESGRKWLEQKSKTARSNAKPKERRKKDGTHKTR